MIATDQSRPLFITWLISPSERISPGKLNSRTLSSVTPQDGDWLVTLIAAVPTVLFRNELATLAWKGELSGEEASTTERPLESLTVNTFMNVNITLKCYFRPLLYAVFLRRWKDFPYRKTVAGQSTDNPKIQVGDPVSSIGVTYRSRDVSKKTLALPKAHSSMGGKRLVKTRTLPSLQAAQQVGVSRADSAVALSFFQAAQMICFSRQLVWSESLLGHTSCLRVTTAVLISLINREGRAQWIWSVSRASRSIFFFTPYA